MLRHLAQTAKKILIVSWRAISVFLEQATAQGTKSTILRPLQWMVLVLALALLGALKYQSPTWLLVALFVSLLLLVIALLVAYFYCLFSGKQPLIDALRTEHYSIQKLAIEKGYVGDSLTGLSKLEDGTGVRPISEDRKGGGK
jgi:glucan phosphoethanolaminetransferase (alkaline phosphatase superfamily)